MVRKTEMTSDEETFPQGGGEDVEDKPEEERGSSPDAPGETREAPQEKVLADGEEFPGQGGREGQAPTDAESALKTDVEILQDDLGRLQDQHLRLAADFENYRKRVSVELASGWVRAQAELARSLLEGLDDLQRVSRFTSEDATLETLIEGVDLVERKFLKALTDAGLESVDPTGEVFDPNTMEAMMRVPTEEEGQDETVHQVFQKGYLFKDQLIRPARVSVFKDDD